jgi:hypothetical protein
VEGIHEALGTEEYGESGGLKPRNCTYNSYRTLADLMASAIRSVDDGSRLALGTNALVLRAYTVRGYWARRVGSIPTAAPLNELES